MSRYASGVSVIGDFVYSTTNDNNQIYKLRKSDGVRVSTVAMQRCVRRLLVLIFKLIMALL